MRLYPTGSGSAVVTTDGTRIGIATAGLTRTLPAAIPAVTIERVVREVLATGRVRRGYLGVGVQPVVLPDAQRGLILLSTEAGSAAAAAGLLVGDILTALNGSAVNDPGDLQAILAGLTPGTTAEARVIRGGAPAVLQIQIGDRPQRG
jgi:S1-C subfamily serine protease